jgi:pimeloyl-ACP methyl ester carboxylesterase
VKALCSTNANLLSINFVSIKPTLLTPKRKRKIKRLLIGFVLFLVGWLVFAQVGLRFTTSDKKAVADFAATGITLLPKNQIISGHKIHYLQTGSDTLPTLFFIHGSPGSWTAFEDYLKDSILREHFRLIAVDRPGFGASEFGEVQNLSTQILLLTILLQQIYNGQPLHLIGHSYGGPLAFGLATALSQKVTSVVALAASVDPAAETPERWRKIFLRNPLQYFLPGAFRPSNEELWALKKDLTNMPGLLQQVQCKVLLVHGKQDGLVPYTNVAWAQAQLMNAKKVEVVSFEKEGHFIPWTKFEDIRDLLLRLKEEN